MCLVKNLKKYAFKLDITSLYSYVYENKIMLYPVLLYISARFFNAFSVLSEIVYRISFSDNKSVGYSKINFTEHFADFYNLYIWDYWNISQNEKFETDVELLKHFLTISFDEDELLKQSSDYPRFIWDKPQNVNDKCLIDLFVLDPSGELDVLHFQENLQKIIDDFLEWI